MYICLLKDPTKRKFTKRKLTKEKEHLKRKDKLWGELLFPSILCLTLCSLN